MTEGAKHVSDTGRPQWTSQWRASYRPGDWVVLTGPTSLVVLQPAKPQWSDLINAVWEDVLGSASIEDIAERLAGFRLDAMPDFAALFWEQGQMRSLVRGRVAVLDPDSGRVIAAGDGIKTWAEVGLGDLTRAQLQLGEPIADEPVLELPLVIGAVTASAVVLDAGESVQISSPQASVAGDLGALHAAPGDRPAEPAAPVPASPAEPAAPEMEPAAPPMEPAAPPVVPPAHQAAEEPESESASTLVGQPPVPPTESGDDEANTIFASSLPGVSGQPRASSALGVLNPSSGGRVEIDRPVVIGRAPVASRVAGPQLPRVLTVPSPSNDISRTHVQVAPENGRLVITDLNSTNGTVVQTPDGHRSTLTGGVGVPIDFGSVIDLGDGITITVDRVQ